MLQHWVTHIQWSRRHTYWLSSTHAQNCRLLPTMAMTSSRANGDSSTVVNIFPPAIHQEQGGGKLDCLFVVVLLCLLQPEQNWQLQQSTLWLILRRRLCWVLFAFALKRCKFCFEQRAVKRLFVTSSKKCDAAGSPQNVLSCHVSFSLMMRSEKPICAPPCLAKASQALPLKQF